MMNVVAIIQVVSDWRDGSVAKSTSVREDMGLIPALPGNSATPVSRNLTASSGLSAPHMHTMYRHLCMYLK